MALAGGETVGSEIAGIRQVVSDVAERGGLGFGATAVRLNEAASALEEATRAMLRWLASDQQSALAGASQYLRLFGLALGGACLPRAGLPAPALGEGGGRRVLRRRGLARVFACDLALAAAGRRAEVVSTGQARPRCGA